MITLIIISYLVPITPNYRRLFWLRSSTNRHRPAESTYSGKTLDNLVSIAQLPCRVIPSHAASSGPDSAPPVAKRQTTRPIRSVVA